MSMPIAKSKPVRTNARGERTRAQLLESAVALLEERGYAGLSIAALCEHAAVAPTAIYWHFGSKAGLMEAVLGRIDGGFVERIRVDVAATTDPDERLDRLIAGIRELVTTQPLGSLTGIAIVSEGAHVAPELKASLRSAREREFATIAGEFSAVQGIEPALGETLTVLVLACSNYAGLCFRMEHDYDEVDRVLAGLRDAITRLAGPDAP
jgi:AcrR family transcriptional regulator